MDTYYLLDLNACVECGVAIKNCQSCQEAVSEGVSYIQCLECSEGFFLHNNKCIEQCPQGTYLKEVSVGEYSCTSCTDELSLLC